MWCFQCYIHNRKSTATHSPAAKGVSQPTETVLPNEIHAVSYSSSLFISNTCVETHYLIILKTPGKESNVQLNSPPTITSTNKSRPRNTDEVVKYNSGKPGSQPKLKSIKIEKVGLLMKIIFSKHFWVKLLIMFYILFCRCNRWQCSYILVGEAILAISLLNSVCNLLRCVNEYYIFPLLWGVIFCCKPGYCGSSNPLNLHFRF